MRRSVGNVEEVYRVMSAAGARGGGEDLLRRAEFFKYHLGCKGSNRLKAVREMTGEGPLELPGFAPVEINNECNEHGMTALGLSYLFGIAGVARDYAQARLLLEIAADDGSPDAVFYVGRMHLGWMNPKPPGRLSAAAIESAVGAFQVAAAAGNLRAVYHLAELT
jgi:hypothetical protein